MRDHQGGVCGGREEREVGIRGELQHTTVPRHRSIGDQDTVRLSVCRASQQALQLAHGRRSPDGVGQAHKATVSISNDGTQGRNRPGELAAKEPLVGNVAQSNVLRVGGVEAREVDDGGRVVPHTTELEGETRLLVRLPQQVCPYLWGLPE